MLESVIPLQKWLEATEISCKNPTSFVSKIYLFSLKKLFYKSVKTSIPNLLTQSFQKFYLKFSDSVDETKLNSDLERGDHGRL